MRQRAIALQAEIPTSGMEGGLALIDKFNLEILNEYLKDGWFVDSISSNHAGSILVVIQNDELSTGQS